MGTQYSVFSRIKGENAELDHHAMGNTMNLFTEIDLGTGGRGYGEATNNYQETYWGIKSLRENGYLPESRDCTFVGIHTSQPTSIGATWHHETIDPDLLSPSNMWVAQMGLRGKWVPPDKMLTLPPQPATVKQLLATDDAHVYWKSSLNYGDRRWVVVTRSTFLGYLKFNLGGIDLETVSAATLKLWVLNCLFN